MERGMNNKLGGTTPCTLQTAMVLAAQHTARLRGHQEMLKKDANFLWLETGPLSSPTASSCLLLLASPPRLSSPASLPLTRAAPKTRDTHAFRGASAVTPGTPHTPHTIGIGSYCLFVRKRIRCSGISPQIPLSPPTPNWHSQPTSHSCLTLHMWEAGTRAVANCMPRLP